MVGGRWLPRHEALPVAPGGRGRARSRSEVVRLVTEDAVPEQAVPGPWLGDAEVWSALLPRMPLASVLPQLGHLTGVGLLTPGSETLRAILGRLEEEGGQPVGGLHPLAVLIAQRGYARGTDGRGRLCWTPVRAVLSGLDEAFYRAYGNVRPVGKRLLQALDVSGSMATSQVGDSGLTARDASVAMALVTAAVEPGCVTVAFAPAGGVARFGGRWAGGDSGLTLLDLAPGTRLEEALGRLGTLSFGGTDLALPIHWARRNRLEVEGFVNYTDTETWALNMPFPEALRLYRSERVPAARAVVVGLASGCFRASDPNDRGMLDISGFDGEVPGMIADFLRES